MAKENQKAALLAAKDQLLTAYTSVHTSLGHLIGLVHQSDPRAIAETLGAGPGLPIPTDLARYGHSPPAMQQSALHLIPHRQPYPSSAPGYPHTLAHAPRLSPSEPHPQSHSRQASQNGPGPSFTTVTPYAPQSRAQFVSKPQPGSFAAQESEDEEEEEEHEEQMSEDEPAGPAHAPQHTYGTAVQLPLKKGREKKVKKERDPNAPKRPASAYILFQNAVRKEMRAANPTADYKELARQIGDRWKNLSEEAKKPWSEAGKQAMSSWNIQNREYKTLHPEMQSTSPRTLSTASSAVAAPVKRRRAPKTPASFDAAGNPIRKKRGRPSKADKAEQELLVQQQQGQYQPHPQAFPPAAAPLASHPVQNGALPSTNGNGPGGYAAVHQQVPHPGPPVTGNAAEDDDSESDEDDSGDGGEDDTDSEEGQVPSLPHNGIPRPPVRAISMEEEEDDEDEEEGDDDDDDDEADPDNESGPMNKKMKPTAA